MMKRAGEKKFGREFPKKKFLLDLFFQKRVRSDESVG